MISGAAETGGDLISEAASFLTPFFGSNAMEEANKRAKANIEQGYGKAEDYITGSYEQSRGDIQSGTSQSAGTIGAGYEKGISAQQPYEQYGKQGLQSLADLGTKSFQFDYTQDPGYQARLAEGTNAIESSSAAKGGLLSSGTLKMLNKYSQNFASNEYGNAFNRAMTAYQTDTQKQYQTGSALANAGQTAATNISNMYTGQGTAIGNLYSEQGANLSNLATGYGQNMGNISIGRGSALADLDVQRGNIKAGAVAGYGQALSGLGENVSKWGEERLLSKSAPVTRVKG